MTGRLVVVTGTGTEIGKTHVSEAVLRGLGAGHRAIGIKPVESGLATGEPSDADRLARASTFHVEHFAYRFDPPVSPHLAARAAGVTLDFDRIRASLAPIRPLADVLLVELPGGLFTPLSDSLTNADLARALAPDVVVLVAPDRLGVLHDVGATLRAASIVPLDIAVIALVRPAATDASTGSNAAELRRLHPRVPVVGIPRAAVADLVRLPDVTALALSLLAPAARE